MNNFDMPVQVSYSYIKVNYFQSFLFYVHDPNIFVVSKRISKTTFKKKLLFLKRIYSQDATDSEKLVFQEIF